MTGHRLLPVALLLALGPGDGRSPGAPDPAGARIFTDPGRGALVIDLAPLELPARTPHHALAQPPVATLEIPSDGYIHGFRVAVVDSAGRELSDELIHHFNLIDPDHRELFLPISRRLLAAGHETGAVRLPGLLFGLPLRRGEHVVASAMVENLTPVTYHEARVRLVMDFTPTGRPWPLFPAAPVPAAPARGSTSSCPTPPARAARAGGGGGGGGLSAPAGGGGCPPAAGRASLYRKDSRHYMRQSGGHEMRMADAMPMKLPM